MRHILAIIILVGLGLFVGFDTLFEAIGIKNQDYGIPSCSNKYIKDTLIKNYSLDFISKNPSMNGRQIGILREGTKIRLSDFKEYKSDRKTDIIHCKANFKAKNDSFDLYFQSEGIVDYKIHLTSKQEIESIPRKYIQGGKKIDYESAPTQLLIKNVYAEWDIQKFETE